MPNNGMHFRHEINKKYLELPATNEIKQEQELFDKSTEGAERDSTRMDEALSKEEIIRQELFGESTEDRECSHVRNDKILEYKNPQTEAVEGENLSDFDEPKNLERCESEPLEVVDKVRAITTPYYEQAGELARNNDMGRAFTDHKVDHVEMVADKSLEVADSIRDAVDKAYLGNNSDADDHVAFSSDIDKITLKGAALSHDTGMAGNGYALTPVLREDGKLLKDENGKKVYEKDVDGNYVIHPENNNFKEVRENHSLNSAINVLKNRDQYKEAGYTDEQVDKMAVECMAHSKSNSGVANLNSKSDWLDCFDRIDATVETHNKDHSDSPISFDRSAFENDANKLGSLASETFALRVGDVSRDSFAGAEAHSGEKVNVDRDSLNNRAGLIEGELEGAIITIGDNRDSIDSIKSRQVHAGEQNICDNHTYLGNGGSLTHEITVSDGVSAPQCTQEALRDHLGELASARDGEFDVNIEFTEPCDDYARESYEKFRDDATGKYENVSIHYPWDEEE